MVGFIALEATKGLAGPPVASRALRSSSPGLKDSGEDGLQVAAAAVALVPASISSSASAVSSLSSVASSVPTASASLREGSSLLHEADLPFLKGEATGSFRQEGPCSRPSLGDHERSLAHGLELGH